MTDKPITKECDGQRRYGYSSVASASAGIELMHNVVIVMGNSPRAVSPFVIGHAVIARV